MVEAFTYHYRKTGNHFRLVSHIDDIFGGAISERQAGNLKSQLIAVGRLTTAVMNPLKCRGPAQSLVIIGHLYDAQLRRVKLPVCKQLKYLAKLRIVLSTLLITSKVLESLLGYLGWAS